MPYPNRISCMYLLDESVPHESSKELKIYAPVVTIIVFISKRLNLVCFHIQVSKNFGLKGDI